MYGRAADRLAREGRERWVHVAFADALVEPGEPGEHACLVVDKIADVEARPGFEAHDVDAARREFGTQYAAARARADDDDHGRVIVGEAAHRPSSTGGRT